MRAWPSIGTRHPEHRTGRTAKPLEASWVSGHGLPILNPVQRTEDLDRGDAGAQARVAGIEDAVAAAVLLDRFNREFDTPTPGPEFLTERLRELVAEGLTHVLIAGDGPDGVALMRVRSALFSAGNEAYVEELYVVPEARRRGLGEALMNAAIELAREQGCDRIDLGTDEEDEDAHRLYERLGFTNFTDEEKTERMLFYERDL